MKLLLTAALTAVSTNAFQHHHTLSLTNTRTTTIRPHRTISTTTNLNLFNLKQKVKGKVEEPAPAVETAKFEVTFPSFQFNRLKTVETAEPVEPVPAEEVEWSFNPFYFGLWLFFVSYAFIFSPGASFNEPVDTAILQAFIDNPTAPVGVNEIFYTVFNLFAVIPVVLASLLLPGAERAAKLPAWPFVGAASFIGFFALGPYMTIRKPVVDAVEFNSLGKVASALESNKLISYGALALGLATPFTAGLYNINQDMVDGFVTLFQSSKFAAVSTVDLSILALTSALLIPEDLRRRNNSIDENKARLIGFATLLLPVIGGAAYVAFRPSLEEQE